MAGERELNAMGQWLETLRRDPARALQLVNYGRVDLTKEGDLDQFGEMKDVLRQVAYDYQNLGGLSPETRQMIGGLNVDQFVGDREDQRGTKQQLTGQLIRGLQQGTAGLATVAGGLDPAKTRVTLAGRDPTQSMGEYAQAYITNQMLNYLDPNARRAAQESLFRSNPAQFRAYGLLKDETPTTAPQQLDRTAQLGNLTRAVQELDWNQLGKNLGGTSDTLQETASPAAWLRNYLTTAQQGLRADSRAGQLQAKSQLDKLTAEAQANRMGGYLNLANSLVNPQTLRGDTTRIIGQGGALVGPRGPRRGQFGVGNLGLV